MPAFMLQVFELFDSKKTNVIDFSEFTLALSVFHPKAPLQEKAACESERHPAAACAAVLALCKSPVSCCSKQNSKCPRSCPS